MEQVKAQDLKRIAGFAAADATVESGMRIGMGTGSTARFAIHRIAERIAAGELTGIAVVASSTQAAEECYAVGLSVLTLEDPRIGGELDLVIDGADEVDTAGRVTKGGGAALLREKVMAYAASRVAIVVTRDKHVPDLGLTFPVPVEVVPFAAYTVRVALERYGFSVTTRTGSGKMGPLITDNANVILDVVFGEPQDVALLESELVEIPGVVEVGLFTRRTFDFFTVEPDGSVTLP
ncbi:MAG: ribose-5-phosphate isomerase RpiA [Spirochaetaceae bacterium]|nr:MAG: ribose-5-phosphate isomerase RpiA [Spirochaetaceae bacterium]